MMTIAHRSKPGNTEWQYKTIVSRKPPEEWLAARLERVEHGQHARLDINVLFAREISDEDADKLTAALESRD